MIILYSINRKFYKYKHFPFILRRMKKIAILLLLIAISLSQYHRCNDQNNNYPRRDRERIDRYRNNLDRYDRNRNDQDRNNRDRNNRDRNNRNEFTSNNRPRRVN